MREFLENDQLLNNDIDLVMSPEARRNQKKDHIVSELSGFVQNLRSSNLIDKVLLGVDNSEGIAYIFNVFKEPTNFAKSADPRLSTLADVSSRFEQELEDLLVVDVSFVDPNEVESVEKDCEEHNVVLSQITLNPLP